MGVISHHSCFILFLNVGLVGRPRSWLEVSMSICNAGLWESEQEGFCVSEKPEIHGRTIFKNTTCKAKLTTIGTVIGTVLNRHTPSRFGLSEGNSACIPYFPFLLGIWQYRGIKDGHWFKRERIDPQVPGLQSEKKATLSDHLPQQSCLPMVDR